MGGVRKIEIASAETTETDDGIAMAMLAAARALAEVKERIGALVNAHAVRRGVSLAGE
jgi:hypothetical protein